MRSRGGCPAWGPQSWPCTAPPHAPVCECVCVRACGCARACACGCVSVCVRAQVCLLDVRACARLCVCVCANARCMVICITTPGQQPIKVPTCNAPPSCLTPDPAAIAQLCAPHTHRGVVHQHHALAHGRRHPCCSPSPCSPPCPTAAIGGAACAAAILPTIPIAGIYASACRCCR